MSTSDDELRWRLESLKISIGQDCIGLDWDGNIRAREYRYEPTN